MKFYYTSRFLRDFFWGLTYPRLNDQIGQALSAIKRGGKIAKIDALFIDLILSKGDGKTKIKFGYY